MAAGGIPGIVAAVEDIEKGVSSSLIANVTNKYRFVTGNLVSGETGYLSLLGWETFASFLRSFMNDTKTAYTPDLMVTIATSEQKKQLHNI